MTGFMLKTAVTVATVLSTVIALFTMSEMFGRSERRYPVETLKRIHKVNGIIFMALFLLVSSLCLYFIVKTRAELSPRATMHSVFALSFGVLFFLKISFVRFYRQFYAEAKTIGFILAVVSFLIAGTSAGYYLLVSKAGLPPASVRDGGGRQESQPAAATPVRTDPESIQKGKELYDSKCSFCHHPNSTNAGVGPGHKGIMKNQLLPVSRKAATPDNVVSQILQPYKDMPSFSYLSEDEVRNLLAFLNTL